MEFDFHPPRGDAVKSTQTGGLIARFHPVSLPQIVLSGGDNVRLTKAGLVKCSRGEWRYS
jgi:hypothetical protein